MSKPNPLARIHSYDLENYRAAKIIVAEPVRYAGLMIEWARAVLKRVKIERPVGTGDTPKRAIEAAIQRKKRR